MPSLRTRKVIYLCVAAPASALWIPVSLVGIAIVVGALGLLCIGSLLRCITRLPIKSKPARAYYTASITCGVLLMSAFIVTSALNAASYWSLLISGAGLTIVGVMVLVEMYAGGDQPLGA